MKTKHIDLLNIGLIIISLFIAVYLPFKLFLFSYAILGPLHYLTQINWLHERNYFIKSKNYWTVTFIIIAVLLSIYPIFKFINIGLSDTFDKVLAFIGKQTNIFLITGFLFAISLIFFKKSKYLIIGLSLAILIAILLKTSVPDYVILIGVFLPTIIHVYIFTLLFILYGAIKSKSKYGIYLAISLFLIPFIICFISIEPMQKIPTQETLNTYKSSNMIYLHFYIAKMFEDISESNFRLFSVIGFRVQIFIAFAYTYHYLNWFSKISIIGWKKNITKKKGVFILALWILSISLYIYDFKIGFIALLFLSFLHVFLEFPLNILTIKELIKIPKKRKTSKP